mmetsp:Transcript_11197/g.22920  ORF Transcript_11197/g.22920 Transcript_11197/m.22920 type:complete len:95 (-) Transcript_11197:21-305(-)
MKPRRPISEGVCSSAFVELDLEERTVVVLVEEKEFCRTDDCDNDEEDQAETAMGRASRTVVAETFILLHFDFRLFCFQLEHFLWVQEAGAKKKR